MSHRSKEKYGGGCNFANKGKANFGANSYARELPEMPDHSNAATRETEERLGPFIFDKSENDKDLDVVTRGPYELDNGAIYHGQWTK